MSWRWPSDQQYRNETGAILRFDQHIFSTNLNTRGSHISHFWSSPNYVEVPLPNQIGTLINMDYTTESQRILNDRNFLAGTEVQQNTIPGTLKSRNNPTTGPDMNRRSPGGLQNDLSYITPRANDDGDDPRMAFLDVIDTTWLGQSRRKYNFTINFTCKSIADSAVAGSICNFMSGQCLPYLQYYNANDIIANQRAFHPPMWAIHVENNDGDRYLATRAWLGEYPQLCVLQKVNAIRLGGEGNNVIGMRDPTSSTVGFVPIIYQLQLGFIELEPVYRSTNGESETRSRSQFFQ